MLDIRVFNSSMIYQHVSESYKARQEQVSMREKMNAQIYIKRLDA